MPTPEEKALGESMLSSLVNAIRNDPEIGPRYKELEELDKEAKEVVEHVDLSIAFSPVLIHGYSTDDAVTVDYQGADGRYVIKGPPMQIVSAEELKLMRARYLIVNGRENQKRYAPLFERLKGKTP